MCISEAELDRRIRFENEVFAKVERQLALAGRRRLDMESKEYV